MTLKEAIKKAQKIETCIWVTEGWAHQARVSKKDALLACEDYLKDNSTSGDDTWENEEGSIIAVAYWDTNGNEITTLSIGR